MTKENQIKIAIAGIGNCASSLIQGITYYRNRPDEITGLTERVIKGWDVSDIEIVAAYDVDKRKVGRPLSEAIFSNPNVTTFFEKEILDNGTVVLPAPLFDGFPNHMKDFPPEKRFCPLDNLDKISKRDIIDSLVKAKPDFLLCYLPVGAVSAVEFFADCALFANVSFINAMPVFIASNRNWINKFKEKKLLILGDDIKSQIGSTIIHRIIVNAFHSRGVQLNNTYQLNIGGNTDFMNMLDRSRTKFKVESKINSVRSQCKVKTNNIHAGPAEYIPYLKDKKVAHININGSGFGNLSIDMDLKLTVEDSSNSAGVMIDLIRMAKVELDQGKSGALEKLSAYGFKSPIKQFPDGVLFEWFQEWLQYDKQ